MTQSPAINSLGQTLRSGQPFYSVTAHMTRDRKSPGSVGISPLLAIAPGPTRIAVSSACYNWPGVLVEQHIVSPGERKRGVIDRTVISMLDSRHSRFEYRNEFGMIVSCLDRKGTLTLTPEGRVPDLKLFTETEQIHCALERSLIDDVLEELGLPANRESVFRTGVQDEALTRLLRMLLEELVTTTPAGKLYVDSLAHALATRYLLLDQGSFSKPAAQSSGLPPRVVARVREMMEANLDADLSLSALAKESGYSRAHFLRMFRAATGFTPHQYLLDLRLFRAQKFLREGKTDIVDVALACGFSSQAHMSNAFRQRLQTTPGEFRRMVRSMAQHSGGRANIATIRSQVRLSVARSR